MWGVICACKLWFIPDSKVHGAKMGTIWGRQDPGGPHVGPMNFAFWDVLAESLQCYAISCYVGPLYNGTRRYLNANNALLELCLESTHCFVSFLTLQMCYVRFCTFRSGLMKALDILGPEQNSYRFVDNVRKCILLNELICSLLRFHCYLIQGV